MMLIIWCECSTPIKIIIIIARLLYQRVSNGKANLHIAFDSARKFQPNDINFCAKIKTIWCSWKYVLAYELIHQCRTFVFDYEKNWTKIHATRIHILRAFCVDFACSFGCDQQIKCSFVSVYTVDNECQGVPSIERPHSEICDVHFFQNCNLDFSKDIIQFNYG